MADCYKQCTVRVDDTLKGQIMALNKRVDEQQTQLDILNDILKEMLGEEDVNDA